MRMSCVDPAKRRNCDKVMTEVHKDINKSPIVEMIGFMDIGTMDEPKTKSPIVGDLKKASLIIILQFRPILKKRLAVSKKIKKFKTF